MNKVKAAVCLLITAGLYLLVFACFPVCRVRLHEREAYVLVTRIYGAGLAQDVFLDNSGRVVEGSDAGDEVVGRIFFSTTEGFL